MFFLFFFFFSIEGRKSNITTYDHFWVNYAFNFPIHLKGKQIKKIQLINSNLIVTCNIEEKCIFHCI